MKTREEIIAAILELPPEDQWWIVDAIRDALPKRRVGRPHSDGPTKTFLWKLEACRVFASLPNDMPEIECIRAAQKVAPELGFGPLQRLYRNEDSRFRRERRRWASTEIPNFRTGDDD